MKRVYATFFLLIFLYNTLGYYIVFLYNQHFIQSELRVLIKSHHFDNKCVVFTFTFPIRDKNFRRLNKHEFRYHDSLYDIVSEEFTISTVTIRCIADNKEDELIAGFSRTHEFANGQNKSSTSKQSNAMVYHIIKLAMVENAMVMSPPAVSKIKHFITSCPLSSIIFPPLPLPPEVG